MERGTNLLPNVGGGSRGETLFYFIFYLFIFLFYFHLKGRGEGNGHQTALSLMRSCHTHRNQERDPWSDLISGNSAFFHPNFSFFSSSTWPRPSPPPPKHITHLSTPPILDWVNLFFLLFYYLIFSIFCLSGVSWLCSSQCPLMTGHVRSFYFHLPRLNFIYFF